MALRNDTKISKVSGTGRSCKKAAVPAKRSGRSKKTITAMVPARFFSGTPDYAKGVVGKWGRTISFEDHPFFLV